MNLQRYKEIVQKSKPKTSKIKKILFSFISGGVIGIIGQFLFFVFNNLLKIDTKESIYYMFITVCVITLILTVSGVYKKISSKLGAGLFLPSTGFVNATLSSSIESTFEGPIYGFGSKIFTLSGSVIVFGIISAIVFGFIYYLLMILGVL